MSDGIPWAVIGAVIEGPGDDVLAGRAQRIQRWVAEDRESDPRRCLGGAKEAMRRSVEHGMLSGWLDLEDRNLALGWLRAASRRDPRPGASVLQRVHDAPVPQEIMAGDPGWELSHPPTMEQALALAREWEFMANMRVDEDVPWSVLNEWDTQGMLAVTVRGFLPDPYGMGVPWGGDGDWRGWLWTVNDKKRGGGTPVWVDEFEARRRLFCVTEVGLTAVPIRADVDDIRAYPPRIGATAWLVRRAPEQWWICWPVREG